MIEGKIFRRNTQQRRNIYEFSIHWKEMSLYSNIERVSNNTRIVLSTSIVHEEDDPWTLTKWIEEQEFIECDICGYFKIKGEKCQYCEL